MDVLFNEKFIRHIMKKFLNKLHRIGTYHASKTFLSCFDDKRYISGDDFKNLAHFHKDVRSQ